MHVQVEKQKKNKSKAVTNSISQKKSKEKKDFGFVNNCPEAIFQLRSRQIIRQKSSLDELSKPSHTIQLRKINMNDSSILIPKTKTHIKAMVARVFGKPSDIPREMDGIAESLVTFAGFGEEAAIHKPSRNCAAVVATDDDEMLVSFNQRRVTPTAEYMRHQNSGNVAPQQGLPWNMQATRYEVLPNIEGMHAECTLAQELSSRHPGVQFSEIGITQPCCMLCAAVMIIMGYEKSVRGYHTKNVANWVCPDAIQENLGNIKLFIGDEAYSEIEKISSTDELLPNFKEYIRILSQNHNGW